LSVIEISKDKTMIMGDLFTGTRNSMDLFKNSLDLFKYKAASLDCVDNSAVVSNINDAISVQENQSTEIDRVNQEFDDFIESTIDSDSSASDLIVSEKNDFYKEFPYLKPESEKKTSFWSGIVSSTVDWCKEHWKAIATVIIVVVAVAVLIAGVSGIIAAAAVGALIGAALGGITGGIISLLTGKSFWEGFENGAFSGAITGIISGALGFQFSGGGKGVLTLLQTVITGAASNSGAALITDIGDVIFSGKKISVKEIIFDTIVSGVIGGGFSALSFGVSKLFSSVLNKLKWSPKQYFQIGKTSKPNYGVVTSYRTSNPKGISLVFSRISDGKCLFRIEFDASHFLHYHLPSVFSTKAHIPAFPIIDSLFSEILFQNARE